ncbi:MAG: hypothetical protein QM535_20815 [Limnohabitans sp.]|nr:hypothetical protein [Limnohabitans sp.]
MDTESIYEIEFSGHSTKREWAVYIIIVIDKKSDTRKLYVGKVGDNRDGCNPILSRIGNHFSLNKIHSQLRNKIVDTTIFDYKVLYSIFGEYNKTNHSQDRQKINQIERQLNLIIQNKASDNFELLNPYKGIGVTKKISLERKGLLSENEIKTLTQMADRAISVDKPSR